MAQPGSGPSGNAQFAIAVLPGDGIGPEVMAPCLALLDGLGAQYGFELTFTSLDAGAGLYRRTGEALPVDVLNSADAADAILLGATIAQFTCRLAFFFSCCCFRSIG